MWYGIQTPRFPGLKSSVWGRKLYQGVWIRGVSLHVYIHSKLPGLRLALSFSPAVSQVKISPKAAALFLYCVVLLVCGVSKSMYMYMYNVYHVLPRTESNH